jgi:hypothetical protein
MLNTIADFEAAASACTPFSEGARRRSVVRAARPHQGAIAFARPRAFRAADVFGRRLTAADLGVALGQPNPGKPNYPYMTRIAASGGAKGPHPAREPEPV